MNLQYVSLTPIKASINCPWQQHVYTFYSACFPIVSLLSCPSFALISDPECECEGPSPAAEPAAAPYGKQGVRIGSGERGELLDIKQGVRKQECANNTRITRVCLSNLGII